MLVYVDMFKTALPHEFPSTLLGDRRHVALRSGKLRLVRGGALRSERSARGNLRPHGEVCSADFARGRRWWGWAAITRMNSTDHLYVGT